MFIKLTKHKCMEVKLQTQNGNDNESVNGNMISQIYDYIKMEDEI